MKKWITFKEVQGHDWPEIVRLQITGVPQEALVTVVKPGLPTTADLYVLPQDGQPAKKNMYADKVEIFQCHLLNVGNSKLQFFLLLFFLLWSGNSIYSQRILAIMQTFTDHNISFVVRGGLQVHVMLADPNAGMTPVEKKKCDMQYIYFVLL